MLGKLIAALALVPLLLASIALAGWTILELPKIKEAELDARCARLESIESRPWLVPPQKRNHEWVAKQKAEREACENGRLQSH